MNKDYTSLIIRNLYDETSLLEDIDLEEALFADEALRQAFEELEDGYHKLPKVLFEPSDRCIENILDYSRQATPLFA